MKTPMDPISSGGENGMEHVQLLSSAIRRGCQQLQCVFMNTISGGPEPRGTKRDDVWHVRTQGSRVRKGNDQL